MQKRPIIGRFIAYEVNFFISRGIFANLYKKTSFTFKNIIEIFENRW
jgi:hypothetical protein